MARRKKYTRKSSSCPEPINSVIDLIGAAAMGVFTKQKIKRDYAKGRGEDSLKAATMVYGMGAMRHGSEGLIALGGLLGVNSAIKDIERTEQRQKPCVPGHEDWDELRPYIANDNQYAWRLNCVNGSEYGIYPEDYETREEYNIAIRIARDEAGIGVENEDEMGEDPFYPKDFQEPMTEHSVYRICRVSLLGDGENARFLTLDEHIAPGDMVQVVGTECEKGIVLTVEELSGHILSVPLNEMKMVTRVQS